MYGYIYLTTNLINGMKYVGMHKGEIDDTYLGSGSLLLKDIKKYGRENFTKKILDIANNAFDLANLENFYISILNANVSDEYYNVCVGGCGMHSLTQETKTRLSKLAKERWKDKSSDEYKKFCEIMSNAVKGSKNPNYGNKWTEEQKKRLSLKRIANGKSKGKLNGMYGHKDENALNGKKVYMYDLHMNLIKTFNTKKMAMDFLNVKSHTKLNKAIKSGEAYRGYIWKMEYNKV